jgi:glyoxalase family protein
MPIQGIHHLTLVCGDAQRTVDFYTGVLGLRLVKQTVNQDAPDTYHIFFGDERGTPGSSVTFFEWPRAPKGSPGIGGTHHFALGVTDVDGLLRWKRRLTDLGISVTGPLDRHYFKSIYFRDPDGVILEIATLGPGFAIDEDPDRLGETFRPPPEEMILSNRDEARIEAETWPQPVPEITFDMALMHGVHHVSALSSDIERTHAFYNGVLGIPLVKKTSNFDNPDSPHWYWGLNGGEPGTLITYFGLDPATARRVQLGRGQMHHIALGVPDEQTQLEFREKLVGAGFRATQVIDRFYFKSVYSNDPDGHIVEIATHGPGYTVDEDLESLGQTLKLTPWLEPHREEIEAVLTPLRVPKWQPPARVG